jgi:hypothetical protein
MEQLSGELLERQEKAARGCEWRRGLFPLWEQLTDADA